MRRKFEFDWRDFSEDGLYRLNEAIKNKEIDEDELFAKIPAKIGREYLIDLHYENYGGGQKGFDVEIYERNSDGSHGTWLGSVKTIKTATNYKRFCRRVEDAVLNFLAS